MIKKEMQTQNHKTEISVVIPVYNRRELLKKTLTSLKNQSLNKDLFEIIVVDDGSTEDLLSVCEEIKKNGRINLYYFKQKNQGPGAARNLGASKAKSDIIALIDSDVLADKDWLKNALEIFKKNPDLGAVEGKTIVPEKEKITPFTHQTENLKGGRYPTCNFILQKKLCKFYPGYSYAFREDSDLAFSILQQGYKIQFSEKVLAYHPPLPAKRSTPFKLASRYKYDYLLKKRFPHYYKKLLDVHKIAFLRIPQLRKKIYFTFVLSLLLFSFNFLLSIISPPKYSSVFQVLQLPLLFVMIISFLVNYIIQLKTINIKSTGLFGLLWLIPISISVPFIASFSLLQGRLLFRNTPKYKSPAE